jgi:hypothetical protein
MCRAGDHPPAGLLMTEISDSEAPPAIIDAFRC